jgi:hypothetical protein
MYGNKTVLCLQIGDESVCIDQWHQARVIDLENIEQFTREISISFSKKEAKWIGKLLLKYANESETEWHYGFPYTPERTE